MQLFHSFYGITHVIINNIHYPFSPNLGNDDQARVSTDISRFFVLPDQKLDGLFLSVFKKSETSPVKTGTNGYKKPGNKKNQFSKKETFHFFYFRVWQTT